MSAVVDKEFVTIVEFVQFAYDILGKKNKGASNMYKLICKSKKVQVEKVKQAFSLHLSTITQWSDFTTEKVIYKQGLLSFRVLEAFCKKDEEDYEAFKEYMDTLQALYFDIQKNLNEFITKLNLDAGSPEYQFISNMINGIGGDVLEAVKDGGANADISTMIPKVMELVQSGKLMNMIDKFKDGQVRMSKILMAVALLCEQYEETDAQE